MESLARARWRDWAIILGKVPCARALRRYVARGLRERALSVAKIIAFGVFAAASFTAAALLPFLDELPVYLAAAKEVANGIRISGTGFWAVGYPVLLAPAYAALGLVGIVWFQTVVLIATGILFYAAVSPATPSDRLFIALFSAFAFNPYLYLNVARINESAVAIVLLPLLFLALRQREIRPSIFAAAGVSAGAFIMIRPNAVVFLAFPVLLMLAQYYDRPSTTRRPVLALFLFMVCAAATMALISSIGTGKLLYWPGNGPYNLFAGNNPYALRSFLVQQNGEPSLPAALTDLGLANADPHVVQPSVYLAAAREFIRSNPVLAAELFALKLGVLLSPRLFNADTLSKVVVQCLLVYPVLLWAISVAAAWRRRKLGRDELYAGLFIAFFVLPFAITNADPRMRFPLDVVLVFDASLRIVSLSGVRRTAR